MSCKKATASDVDRQHIARRTATWAMSASTPQPLRPTTASANPTSRDAYELRSEPAADYAGNRIVSYCFSARPATLLHLPRRHSGLRRGPAVRRRAVTAAQCEYKKFLKNSQISQMSDPEALHLMPRRTSKIRSNRWPPTHRPFG